MAKKLVKLNEEEKVEPVDETVAADSLGSGSHKVSDEGTITHRTEILAKMIGAAHAMQSDELLKHFNAMMAASHNQSRGAPDKSASNKATLKTHPSSASHIKEAIKDDVETLLSEQDGLSPEFKEKATTLFEAAVEARVSAIEVELEEAAEGVVQEQLEAITGDLVTGIENYLDYVAKEWLVENEVAIESSLRNEMTSEFINGLKILFTEHNINIPEDQVEIVDTMAQRIEELETRLSELITENAELKSVVSEAEKTTAIDQVCEGLTLVESEKLHELAANVEADDLETFTKKVMVIKESNFVKGAKKSQINEDLDEANPDNAPVEERSYSSPKMSSYAAAITRTIPRE